MYIEVLKDILQKPLCPSSGDWFCSGPAVEIMTLLHSAQEGLEFDEDNYFLD